MLIPDAGINANTIGAFACRVTLVSVHHRQVRKGTRHPSRGDNLRDINSGKLLKKFGKLTSQSPGTPIASEKKATTVGGEKESDVLLGSNASAISRVRHIVVTPTT